MGCRVRRPAGQPRNSSKCRHMVSREESRVVGAVLSPAAGWGKVRVRAGQPAACGQVLVVLLDDGLALTHQSSGIQMTLVCSYRKSHPKGGISNSLHLKLVPEKDVGPSPCWLWPLRTYRGAQCAAWFIDQGRELSGHRSQKCNQLQISLIGTSLCGSERESDVERPSWRPSSFLLRMNPKII